MAYRARTVATLGRIGVTPLKGTRLLHPPEVRLEATGIPSNRRFHLVDERGALFSVTRHGPLVRVHASYDQATGTLALTFPAGAGSPNACGSAGRR
jgi:uncharacterized protein YcbX